MNITIHRGTHQIGGCITEITSGSTRIFIDFGSELPGESGAETIDMLSVPGLTQGRPDCDAVFFTHTHGDHIGQMERILPEIPLYMGAVAKKLHLALSRRLQHAGVDRSRTVDALERARVFQPASPIQVGGMTVTAFCVDHSAFDAYMFLVEGDGVRLLHTGDFRGHGFRGKALIPMLEKYVGQIDWLVCEGTMLSRREEPVLTERQLQVQAAQLMRRHKRVFVLCSSMNIDRIAGFCHAVPDERPIICDDYQKDILDLVQTYSGYQTALYDFSRVRRYSSADHVLRRGMEQQGFLCFIRANRFSEILLNRYRDDAVIVYSMWSGYLSGATEKKELTQLLRDRIWVQLHTSGHATTDTLRAVHQTLRPRKGIIPIHTEVPEVFDSLFPNVSAHRLMDGEELAL